ncbi:hypothetical protein [Almyronema epifaneia]|uniref:Uncharacterized protein n=1 Tax=Almyronema epifaneia S1 TaxID=2991925 RepID=A0ABW6IGT2_9CYAN
MQKLLDELNPFCWMAAVYILLMLTVQQFPASHAALLWTEGLDPKAFTPVDH